MGSSSGGVDRSNRTKEQLYNQAKRLKIPGRSNMTKQQRERAINRAASYAEARAPARASPLHPRLQFGPLSTVPR